MGAGFYLSQKTTVPEKKGGSRPFATTDFYKGYLLTLLTPHNKSVQNSYAESAASESSTF
jgi:hypothetical protein